MKKIIKALIPRRVLDIYKSYKYPEAPVSGWSGNYGSWGEALKKTSGYDAASILEKIRNSILKVMRGEAEYERDSIAFENFEYSGDFLSALKSTVQHNTLSLVDFGGSLGSQYFQYKRFFEGTAIHWMVVEQTHFVECGKKEIANNELHFFDTIENALAYRHANAVLLSSVLPYLEKPFDMIEKIKSYHFEYIIIDRNPFIQMDHDLLTIQVVPEYVYKASYPAWFFNEAKFLKAFADTYTIEKEFDSPFAAPRLINGTQACWKGFILKKKL